MLAVLVKPPARFVSMYVFRLGLLDGARGVVLDGRSFLHDYHAEQDPDGSLLQLLMTAPMLVAH